MGSPDSPRPPGSALAASAALYRSSEPAAATTRAADQDRTGIISLEVIPVRIRVNRSEQRCRSDERANCNERRRFAASAGYSRDEIPLRLSQARQGPPQASEDTERSGVPQRGLD